MKTINYSRMKMDDIHPEARRIAVSWVEGFEKIGTFEIEQKVKLGSDIMHFAMAYHADQKDQEIAKLKSQIERRDHQNSVMRNELTAVRAEIARLTEDRDGLLRKCEELKDDNDMKQKIIDGQRETLSKLYDLARLGREVILYNSTDELEKFLLDWDKFHSNEKTNI